MRRITVNSYKYCPQVLRPAVEELRFHGASKALQLLDPTVDLKSEAVYRSGAIRRVMKVIVHSLDNSNRFLVGRQLPLNSDPQHLETFASTN